MAIASNPLPAQAIILHRNHFAAASTPENKALLLRGYDGDLRQCGMAFARVFAECDKFHVTRANRLWERHGEQKILVRKRAFHDRGPPETRERSRKRFRTRSPGRSVRPAGAGRSRRQCPFPSQNRPSGRGRGIGGFHWLCQYVEESPSIAFSGSPSLRWKFVALAFQSVRSTKSPMGIASAKVSPLEFVLRR